MSRFFNSLEHLEPRRLMSGANAYIQQDQASDGGVTAAHTDSRLVNPWGLAAFSHGFEIADNGTGLSTGYDANGANVGASAKVPTPSNPSLPTGIVTNGDANAFLLNGTAANFIYVTINGTIDAWNIAGGNRTMVTKVDNSAAGDSFTGVAEATFKKNSYLFAADFAHSRIEVFNSSFARSHVSGSFADPNLPKGYAPFNVQQVGGELFVMYAKHQTSGPREQDGAGVGIVDEFSTDGKLIKRFASGGKLNAPWGIAQAPDNFSAFSNDILVGNFGDGRINAFNATTGKFQGQMTNFSGTPFTVDRLWGLAFGNGKGGTLTNGLYFTAGVNNEADGLYGRFVVDPTYGSTTPTPAVATTQSVQSVKHDAIDVDSLIDSMRDA